MNLPANAFKRALAGRHPQIGLWSSLCSNIAAEIVADSGFDWIMFDTEHSAIELPGLLSQLHAAATGTASAVVRPAWNDTVLIKRLLDIGAQSLLVPGVRSAEDAARAVSAVRYPPRGTRGVSSLSRSSRYGRVKGYAATAEREICVLAQIDSAVGLGRHEEIAEVEGIDGVFIDPADLAASMGHAGNPQHLTVQAAMEDAGRCLRHMGKPAGTYTDDEEQARRYQDWGYNFIAVGMDVRLLQSGADALAAKFKSGAKWPVGVAGVG